MISSLWRSMSRFSWIIFCVLFFWINDQLFHLYLHDNYLFFSTVDRAILIRKITVLQKTLTLKLMGHSHGLEVYSPSFGFSPAFPCNITWCDSMNLKNDERGKLRCLQELALFVKCTIIHIEFPRRYLLNVPWDKTRSEIAETNIGKFWKMIIFNIPHSIWVSLCWIARDL